MLHCSCDPLIPSEQVKSEGLIMPFMGMGVKLTVYGSEIVTFKPVDCTRICHSSTMVSTRVGTQVQTCSTGRVRKFLSSSLRGGGVMYRTDELADDTGMQMLQI